MLNEYNVLINQNTWSLVPPSSNTNIIGCKWVYQIKRHLDGSITRYKAHLVTKGFHQ